MGKQASYGVKMLGVGEAFRASPDAPEYKTAITVGEFAEKSGVSLDDIHKLIELEENDDRKGFGKYKKLEKVLFKVIDYRTAMLKRGFFCIEVENFLHPPKAARQSRHEPQDLEPSH